MSTPDFIQPAILIGSMALLQYLDATNPSIVWIVRICYATTILYSCAILAYVYSRIQTLNDQTIVVAHECDVDSTKAASSSPFAAMLGTTVDLGKEVRVTVHEYDTLKLKALARETLLGPLIVLFLHFYFGMFQPLVVSTSMALFKPLSTELVQLHVLAPLFPSLVDKNKTSLIRPWKSPAKAATAVEPNGVDNTQISAEPSAAAEASQRLNGGKKKSN